VWQAKGHEHQVTISNRHYSRWQQGLVPLIKHAHQYRVPQLSGKASQRDHDPATLQQQRKSKRCGSDEENTPTSPTVTHLLPSSHEISRKPSSLEWPVMNNYPPTLGGHWDYSPPKNEIIAQYSNQIIVAAKSIMHNLFLQHSLRLNPMGHEEKEKEGKGDH
jgi:hypothetical protein